MDNKKSSIKLFTFKHGIIAGLSVILGNALAIWALYTQRKCFSKIEIIGVIVGNIIGLTVLISVAYYANRPEKGD